MRGKQAKKLNAGVTCHSGRNLVILVELYKSKCTHKLGSASDLWINISIVYKFVCMLVYMQMRSPWRNGSLRPHAQLQNI